MNNLSWSEIATKSDVPAFISTVKQVNKLAMAGPAASTSADISPVVAGHIHKTQPVSGPPSQQSTDTEASVATALDLKWSKGAVVQLLQEVMAKYSQITDKFTKSKTVWKDIANVLSKNFPWVTESQCSQKW